MPFRDPSKPRTLVVKCDSTAGMTVRGYDGKDAIIEAHGGSTGPSATVERSRRNASHRSEQRRSGHHRR